MYDYNRMMVLVKLNYVLEKFSNSRSGKMEIIISQNALNWFKDSMDLKNGDRVKFYSKIYGSSPVQPNFALGFTQDNDPVDMAVLTKLDGIEFYVENSDVWFFDGHDLHVDYDIEEDELKFNYVKPE